MEINKINDVKILKVNEIRKAIIFSSGTGGVSNPKVIEVKISRAKYPESVKHIEDAIANGQPDVLIIYRAGAKNNRKAALKGREKVRVLDL